MNRTGLRDELNRVGRKPSHAGRGRVAPTIGRRCSRASPVREPTARLMQNWMQSWKMLVQEVHSSTTIPNSAVRQISRLAMVAYTYSTRQTETQTHTHTHTHRSDHNHTQTHTHTH